MSQETIDQVTADIRAAFQKAIAAEDLSPADAVHVYAPWLGKGLQRSHLLTLDKTLYSALGVWLHRHPEDCALLPSRSAWQDGIGCTAGDLAKLRQSLETLQNRRRQLARLAHT